MVNKEQFSNSPIREAVGQIIFDLPENCQPTARLLAKDLKDIFPEESVEGKLFVNFNLEKREIVSEQQEMIQLLSKDKKMILRVDQNLLSIHQLTPYKSWGDFEEKISLVIEKYIGIFSPTSVRQISLRYVNQIDIRDEAFEQGKYFNINIQAENVADNFTKSVALRFGDLKSERQTTIQLTENLKEGLDNERFFILDIDHVSREAVNANITDVMAKFKDVHDGVESIFFKTITEESRKLFR